MTMLEAMQTILAEKEKELAGLKLQVEGMRQAMRMAAASPVDAVAKVGSALEPDQPLTLTKTRALETALDLAYLAGAARYHSGDSRADIDTFIHWANQFESMRRVDENGEETYNGQNYIEAIEAFAEICLGRKS